MNRLCNYLLAAARFAQYHDGGACIPGQERRQALDLDDLWRITQNYAVAAAPLADSPEIFVFLGKLDFFLKFFEDHRDMVQVEGFREIVVGSIFHGGDRVVEYEVSGHHDNQCPNFRGNERFQQIFTVGVREAPVKENNIGKEGLGGRQGALSSLCSLNFISPALQKV